MYAPSDGFLISQELNVKAQETAQVSFILHECQVG